MDVIGRYEFIVRHVPLVKELRKMVADYIGMEIVGTKIETDKELHLIIGMIGDIVYTRCLPSMGCRKDGIKCWDHMHSFVGDYTSLIPISDGYVLLKSKYGGRAIYNTKTDEYETLYDAMQPCVHDEQVFYIHSETDELHIWSPSQHEVVTGHYLRLRKLGHCLCMEMQNGCMKLYGEDRVHPHCPSLYKWKDRYFYIHNQKVEDEIERDLFGTIESAVALDGFIYFLVNSRDHVWDMQQRKIVVNYRHYVWDLERRKIVVVDNGCELRVADATRLFSTNAKLLIYQ